MRRVKGYLSFAVLALLLDAGGPVPQSELVARICEGLRGVERKRCASSVGVTIVQMAERGLVRKSGSPYRPQVELAIEREEAEKMLGPFKRVCRILNG